MNKSLIFVVLFAVSVAVAGLWFFTYGGNQSEPSKQKQTILSAQDDRFSKGDPTAPVRIIEYSDILCPYCAKVHSETTPRIEAEYIDTDKAYYELRLVAMTAPDSVRAAEGAYCAAEQGNFWEYIDTAYETTWNNYYSQNMNPSDVQLFSRANIEDFAHTVGITDIADQHEWQECLGSGRYSLTLEKNKNDMIEMNGYGTPYFNINGKEYNGSPPYAVFKGVIDAALNKKKADSK